MAAAGGWVRLSSLRGMTVFALRDGRVGLFTPCGGTHWHDPRYPAAEADPEVFPFDARALPDLLAGRADLLALLEVARRDTDGAELGAARERAAGVAHALGLARGFDAQRGEALAEGDRERGLRAEGAAAACLAVADLLRGGGGPLLPPGPLETEQASASALAAENARLREALNGVVDACVRVGFDGGPVGLLRRAVALARKALGVSQ
jgi:hypothetical protein